MSGLVDSIGDVFEGVGDTIKGALDGDLKSIISVGAMAYGGFQAGQAAGWWGEAATGGAEVLAGADMTTQAVTAADTATVAATDAAAATGAATDVAAASAATPAAIPGAEAGLIEGVGTTEAAAAGTELVNAGSMATVEQTAALTEMGYTPSQIASMKVPEINSLTSSSMLDSKWMAPGMMIGGQMVSSMTAAREARKQEEQRIKERGEQSSWGLQRNGQQADISPGQGLIDMQNNLGTNQRPNPSRYTPTRR